MSGDKKVNAGVFFPILFISCYLSAPLHYASLMHRVALVLSLPPLVLQPTKRIAALKFPASRGEAFRVLSVRSMSSYPR